MLSSSGTHSALAPSRDVESMRQTADQAVDETSMNTRGSGSTGKGMMRASNIYRSTIRLGQDGRGVEL